MQHFKEDHSISQPVFVTYRELSNSENIFQSSSFLSLRKDLYRFTRHLHSDLSSGLAEAVVYEVIVQWWSVKNEQWHCEEPLRAPPLDIAEIIDDPDIWDCITYYARLAVTSPMPVAAYEIGMLYTSLLPKKIRSQHGLFFTPPALAQKLVDLATEAGTDWSTAQVAEPSCGSGVVLLTALEKIAASLTDGAGPWFYKTLQDRVVGYEKDPFCAWMSQVMVDATLLPRIHFTRLELPTLVQCRDALEKPGKRRFDLVIGNPPFCKVRLENDQRSRFERSVFGHANLYALFLDQAIEMTHENGIISLVTPTSYLSGCYFKNLRSLLRQDAQPHSICFLDKRSDVFDAVNQSLALSSFCRYRADDVVSVEQICATRPGALYTTILGSFGLPEDAEAPWILPRNHEQAALVAKALECPCKLSDWGYSVQTGPMIWNRYKDNLASKHEDNTVPLIWAEAVMPGGAFEWSAERKENKRWFRVEPGVDHLKQSEPCLLVQRTTSPEQPRRLNAALLPMSLLEKHGHVVVENHLNIIHSTLASPAVPLQTLAVLLNSGVMDQLMRCISGSCAISATELNALPLPCPSDLACLTDLIVRDAPEHILEAECRRIIASCPNGRLNTARTDRISPNR